MKNIFTWGKSALFAAALLQITVAATAQTAANGAVRLLENYGQMPLRFEQNSGQTDSQVRYISRGNGYAMYFAPTEIVLMLDVSTNLDRVGRPPSASLPGSRNHKIGLAHIRLAGADANAMISAEQTLPEKVNYLVGNDPAQWRTGISVFGRVRYQNVYPGIDLTFYGSQSHLEYDFVVAPHADPDAIQLKLDGADHASIDPNGDLVFSVGGQTTSFQRPAIYQIIGGIRHDVAGDYQLNGNRVGFEIGAYDSTQPLVIDPVLSYSSFLGGGSYNSDAYGVAVDGSGNAYVCGGTLGIPTNLITHGAFQTNFGGGTISGDAYVAKLGSTGTNLIYFTYLGGNSDDEAASITVDNNGDAYITGFTASTNFPTKNAIPGYSHINSTYNGSLGAYPVNAFVTELNSSGSNLVYSTYLGGNSSDGGWGIAVDQSDNAYITGFAYSTNFPVTTNALQKHPACPPSLYWNCNAFVTEIASNGNALVYSTYYGGAVYDYGYGIAVDGSGNIYVTGFTLSPDYPTTNAISSTLSGAEDAFAFKLGPGGTNRIYSTYIGGNGSVALSYPIGFGLQGSGCDIGYGIAVDTNGNAYIVGQTFSVNFPVTNALQTVLNGYGNATISDAFVTKLSPSGQMIYSTFLGGSNTDIAYGVKVQSDGEAVIVGQTGSTDFAPYANYGSINLGNLDGFVAKLSADGQTLMNFAYLGGTQLDSATGVALDSQNNAYVVGYTASPDFPITVTNVVDPTFSGSQDVFIVKLYFEPNQLGTKVVTSWQGSNAWTVIGPPATLAASNTWTGASQIASVSGNGVTDLANTRFQRGVSYDPTYTSFIISLNQQTGFRLDDLGSNSENFGGSFPWFTRLQNDVRTHLSLVVSTNGSGVSTNYYGYVTNFNNPIAAFGATAGQSPLYVNEQFKFGVYCGAQYETTNSSGTNFATPLRILVYNLTSFTNGQTNLVAPIATNYLAIPRRTIANDSTNWLRFATNGFSLTIETNGLRTTIQLVTGSDGAWGVVPHFTNAQSGTWLITEECTTNMGYGYVLEGIGVVPLFTNLYPMVTNSAGVAWDRLFSLDFQTRPPWRSVFIDQPQFNGTPLPSFYQGASLSELTNLNAVVTNSIPLVGNAYTTVDDSPELRRHPTLDQLVANLNNDPIALANYVLNNIKLCDALAYNPNNGQASAPAVNEGGVNRSALDVYLEGQGSPLEQCALLVYLLRQAGYPAAYEFPTNNNVLMLDTRLSALLRMQLRGAVNQFGQLYTTNTLITVNYPWVVTTISNQTVHVFPWLKDTSITEGLNLYDYMPTNYDNGFKWLSHYLYGDTNILGLSAESDAPSVLFPRFVKQRLLANAPGIALDDLGVSAYNRQHYYWRWQDFPTPSVVNNPTQSVCVDSLASPALASVAPGMTNIFDTVTLNVFSQNNPANQMTIGPLRMADLHNREMFMATNGTSMMLWLAPYVQGNTNQGSFSPSDLTLTNIQIATIPVGTNDTLFDIRMTHYRHQAINFSPGNQFLNASETLQFTTPDRPFNVNDIAAVCFNVGRVTPAMIDVHAQAFQQMTYQWSLNTNMIPAVQDYQGAAAYMMGMDYYSHVSAFLPLCEQLHKAQVVSWYAEGISRLTPVQLGPQNFMRPSMDMFYSEMAHAGNGTSHPDSGNDPLAGTDDFASIMDGEIAAQEHGVINGYYQSQNAVSSVVLLRLAQQRSTNGSSAIIELNKNNYLAVGATNAPGYGPTRLMNYDASIWAAVTNAFTGWDADYVRAYITPGPVSVSAANYRGMGLVVVGKSQSASIISVNMNGVLGQQSSYFADTPASLSTIYSASTPMDSFSSAGSADFSAGYGAYNYGGNLYYGGSPYGGSDFNYYWTTPGWYNSPLFWPYVPSVIQYQVTATFTPPSQINLAQQINSLYYFPQSTPVTTSLTHALDSGNTGPSTWKNLKNFVAEPVNLMSGEFYEDTVDLTVAGPMPLQLRRNYSSQNQDDRNGFGYGWNINVVPYITIATNTAQSSTNVVLSAVELDGSVIAYRQQADNTNLFLPSLADNLQLDNFGNGHIGSIHNPFNAKIAHSFSGTNELYTLTQPDGHIRTYIVNSFPVATPTSTISRQRPYLATWQDTQGNSWTFSYGTNSSLPNYGSVIRIQSSNGNYLGLDYNAGGYVIDAYTGDGEKVSYQYDDFGDLILAVRPDASEETYEYRHTQFTNNGTMYVDSTHLLALDFKPDGRLLQNVYDIQRRVTAQLATVGQDLNVYTNAVFTYANNFNLTNAWTNRISGYTQVKDVNGNTIRYDYTNSLVTTNTDQLGQKVIQLWYADNATAPGYPRSLYQTRDKRGLWTQFQYDSRGNLTNSFSWGDLVGDGTTQYATNTASYNANNLPVLLTDPVGNSVQTVYQSQYPYLPQYVIYAPGGTPTVTNQFTFGNVTNVVVNGNLTFTNMAFGLLVQQVRSVNSPDAATNQCSFDGRGYLTQSVQFTGTGDPAVINYFTCNNQGEIIERMDAAGQRTDFAFDDMRRPIAHEVFAAGQTAPMFWEYAYYNENGELNWYDGPNYIPEDYQWFDYDGAGRQTTQIKWRAEAKADGTGLQAPGGYNLYAQSFYQYDKYGNLTLAVDPRGAMTTNRWDAIGQLVQQQHLETNGVTLLSSEGFAYEPGGQVSAYTNALGGVTTVAYTTNGLPKFRSNPDGSTNAWRYGLDGRIKKEIQSNGAYWQTTYDDVNRIVTRIFYSAANMPEATNFISLDRRGNVIQRVDAGGNVFTTAFDGLDRAKVIAGPAIVSITRYQLGNPPSGPYYYATNVLQQAVTNYFDAAGQVLASVNALGEQTVTDFDPIGRPTQVEVFSASASLVRQRTFAYSPDFHSVTVTDGSGANAVSTTAYTDNDGQNVLSIAYPSGTVNEFMLRQFDLARNLVAEQHDSSTSGNVTTWTTASYGYDGLNRLVSKYDRDNAPTTYGFDAMGNLTNRTMPGNLQRRATYNNAGQIMKDWNVSGTSCTRTNSYAYFASGSPFAGLLQTEIDGRNTTNNFSYDDWLRSTNMACTGSLSEQNLTTTWRYEARGFVTNITEQFASTNTGPATVVQRSFDPYGQLTAESVNAISFSSGASQGWDAAGRRSSLTFGNTSYGFGWQADGNLISASGPTSSGTYNFDTAGLLTSRTVGSRFTGIGSRDGEGRPLSITTSFNSSALLSESLTWSGDGLLATHTLVRAGDFTDSRSYAYANSSRRLTQEQLNLNASTTWTNSFVYDNGAAHGPGVLTQMGQSTGSSGKWNGAVDAFSRVSTETNNTFAYAAYGHVNGQANLSAWLDSNPISVTAEGTNAMQWRASMELSTGTHQLKVAALHPSGFYTAWATNSFTNNIAYQTTADAFDGAGNITNRVWRNASGATSRTQSLSWDARGRLHQVIERGTNNSGFNWTATYDGLNRRIQTITVLVSNGVAATAPQTISSCFDPQVEFLELGVQSGSQTAWKLYGPDLNGQYGGLNGVGGLEGVSQYLNTFNSTISDARGNVLAEMTNGMVSWNPSRPTGYGAVPGYRPAPFGSGADMAQSSAWRGRDVDITGYTQLGLRPFDPVSGRWLSFDPLGSTSLDPDGFTFCGGDSVNYLDPDGRIGKAQLRNVNAGAAWADDQIVNIFAGAGYLLDQGAFLATGDPGFGAAAQRWQNVMSPYARRGWYNPHTPTAQLASAATILVAPASAPSRVGIVEMVVTRDVVPTVTRETVQAMETATVQNGVMNNSTRLLTAPPPVNLLTAPRPVALLPENAASLAAGNGDKFMTLYRGEQANTTVMKSYAARQQGYAYSQNLIRNGSINDLMQAHSLNSAKPASPFISATTDANVARFFAGPNGVVYQLQVPVNRAMMNPFNNMLVPAGPGGSLVPESEFLIPNYIRPSEIVK
jgi:RHS repeat-associated protein